MVLPLLCLPHMPRAHPAPPCDKLVALHDVLYHGKHNPDLDAPDVGRKFNNKGEKGKGAGVHRLRCPGLEEG